MNPSPGEPPAVAWEAQDLAGSCHGAARPGHCGEFRIGLPDVMGKVGLFGGYLKNMEMLKYIRTVKLVNVH